VEDLSARVLPIPLLSAYISRQRCIESAVLRALQHHSQAWFIMQSLLDQLKLLLVAAAVLHASQPIYKVT
jgi:hypothetical protein